MVDPNEAKTERQRRTIKAIQEHPELSNRKIAKIAEVSESYLYKIKSEFDIEVQELEDPAQRHRTMESLTDDQRNTVHEIVNAEEGVTDVEVAQAAGVSDSYVNYCRVNFPHLIQDQAVTAMADGGSEVRQISMTEHDIWRAIRLLPTETSKNLYEQIRRE